MVLIKCVGECGVDNAYKRTDDDVMGWRVGQFIHFFQWQGQAMVIGSLLWQQL